MRIESSYSAFNARWLDPEEVARTFVPTPHYTNLVRPQHSLLMGPRGCGKTTLLKMLTRRAQRVWAAEDHGRRLDDSRLPQPNFEALYIPSDVRWSAELEAVSREADLDSSNAERLQRAFVSISSLIEASKVFQDLLDVSDQDPTALLKSLINHFELGKTIPTFSEVRLKLQGWTERLNSWLVKKDSDSLLKMLDSFTPAFTGHALDTLRKACSVYDEYSTGPKTARWALCFDELEIAPEWLQTELFTCLRSTDQRFFLKLTWSPLLPLDLISQQERLHDFVPIRMWHGHVLEAKPFCKEFSTRYIRARFDDQSLDPHSVLGPSLFSQEDEDGVGSYDRGHAAWIAMKDLASRDPSFHEYLRKHGVDPADPWTTDITVRDESLRKIKPIVLIRDTYYKEAGHSHGLKRRSRKNPALYFGEDVLYAMSEGNPRILASLLNDLLDAVATKGNKGSLRVRPELQSRILMSASHRTLAGIRTYPIRGLLPKRSLSRLLERLGSFMRSELIMKDFNADPVGSFIVDMDVLPEMLEQIKIGLLLGAIVHVRSDETDVPLEVMGSRIRLSYMLSPAYKVLFRNYRSIRLSTANRIAASTQRTMFQFLE